MTIDEKQQQIISEFEYLEDWEPKYEYLIDLGKSLAPMPEEYKTDENLIAGCQSKVWISAQNNGGEMQIFADSDGILPKGIVALLVEVFNGQTLQDIAQADVSFIQKIGLQEFLSPSRANGLASMIKQIKLYAIAFQMKS